MSIDIEAERKLRVVAIISSATSLGENRVYALADSIIGALALPQHDPVRVLQGHNDDAVYAIIFDDYERKHEIIIGEAAARARFKRISDSWNAHLFGKIETNSRDSMYANNNFTPPAAPVLSDDEIDQFKRAIQLVEDFGASFTAAELRALLAKVRP